MDQLIASESELTLQQFVALVAARDDASAADARAAVAKACEEDVHPSEVLIALDASGELAWYDCLARRTPHETVAVLAAASTDGRLSRLLRDVMAPEVVVDALFAPECPDDLATAVVGAMPDLFATDGEAVAYTDLFSVPRDGAASVQKLLALRFAGPDREP